MSRRAHLDYLLGGSFVARLLVRPWRDRARGLLAAACLIHTRGHRLYVRTGVPYARAQRLYARMGGLYARAQRLYARTGVPYASAQRLYARMGGLYARAQHLYARAQRLYARTGGLYARMGGPYARMEDVHASFRYGPERLPCGQAAFLSAPAPATRPCRLLSRRGWPAVRRVQRRRGRVDYGDLRRHTFADSWIDGPACLNPRSVRSDRWV
jgi:hypothetical protein